MRLQPVTGGVVVKGGWPTLAEVFLGRTGRRILSAEQKNSLPRCFTRESSRVQSIPKNLECSAAPRTLNPGLAVPVLFSDARDVEAHHGLNIPDIPPIGRCKKGVTRLVDK